MAGMLLGEGLSLLDLTTAPGWPGLNTRGLLRTLFFPPQTMKMLLEVQKIL